MIKISLVTLEIEDNAIAKFLRDKKGALWEMCDWWMHLQIWTVSNDIKISFNWFWFTKNSKTFPRQTAVLLCSLYKWSLMFFRDSWTWAMGVCTHKKIANCNLACAQALHLGGVTRSRRKETRKEREILLSSAPRRFAAHSRVLLWLASLTINGELASRPTAIRVVQDLKWWVKTTS